MLKKFAVAAALAVSVIAFSPVASAADVKMVGVITDIKLAADGKSATATLKTVNGETLPKWVPSKEGIYLPDNAKEILPTRKY